MTDFPNLVLFQLEVAFHPHTTHGEHTFSYRCQLLQSLGQQVSSLALFSMLICSPFLEVISLDFLAFADVYH
jgi:hypothetical protein